MWEIVDKNGKLYTGYEWEMKRIYNDIVYKHNPENIKWTGDVR